MRRRFAILATAVLFGAIATPSLADDHRSGGYGRYGHYEKSDTFKSYKYGKRDRYYRHQRHYKYERRHRRAHHKYERRHRRAYLRHNHDRGYAITGAFVGGAIFGHVLAQPQYRPAYAPVPRVRAQCERITGTGYVNGRRAEFGGSRCIDGYGRTYIAAGSEYFIRYID